MPYRNDQLVGCLPDALQGDLDELINLSIADSNQPQFNQINLNSNQYIVDSHLRPNQMASNLSSNQFEVESNKLRSQTSTSQYLDNNISTTFNFQSTDYDNQLNELNQLDDQSTNYNSNLDIFDIDDELELNHLKDLENLMETNQLEQHQLDDDQSSNNSQVLNENQISSNQLNANNQLTGNQINQQMIINSQQGGSQSSNRAQLNHSTFSQVNTTLNHSVNQASRSFLTSPNTANSTFDSNSQFNANSAQINSPQRTTSNSQTNNSTTDNTFLAAVNNTQYSPQQLSNNNNSNSNSYRDQLANSSLNATVGNNNSLNNNLNLTNNQLNNTFYQEQTQKSQVFTPESEQPPTSTNMIKSDLQTASLLTSSNLNRYQSNQFANQIISSPTQLLNNQTNKYTNSSNLQSPNSQSNMQTSELAIINSPTPAKHINQFKSSSPISNNRSSPTNNNLSKVKSPSNEWLDMIANQVYRDMQNCGICVIDSFLGKLFCNTILDEVIEMYGDGYFQDGLVVGNKQNSDKNVRGDKIHWVEGKESNCQNIGYLMRTLDQIMMRFSRLNVKGCTSIMNRTKAMIACYPGNGTKYVKHVDNATNDGRYITCIYYLNKNWNSERDGGTLRIFPRNSRHVANIEPLFDRVIFFWSDRRNPHEVMPAFSIRFAITLWYFNSEEREQYIKKMQALRQSNQS